MGAVSRVYRKPSLQQEDRLPVSSYDEAVRRLVCIRLDDSIPDDAYDLACALVADIFWRPDKIVRADVVKASRQIGGA